MSPDSNEFNGGGETSEAEFEGRERNVLNSEGDLGEEVDGIAAKVGEEEEEEGIGGSFVIVNGESSDFSDRDLDLDGRGDPSKDGDESDEPVLHARAVAGEEVNGDHESSEGEGVVVEVEQSLENEHGHAEDVAPVTNWEGEINAGGEEGEKDCEVSAEKRELGKGKEEEELNKEISLECGESYSKDDNEEARTVDGKADKGEELHSFGELGDNEKVDIGVAVGVEGLPEVAAAASDEAEVESVFDEVQEPESLGKKSGDQAELRSVDEAEGRRGQETGSIEVDYQPGSESALMESDDQAEASATLFEEKTEPCIATVEAEGHSQSEPADAYVEDKHDTDTQEQFQPTAEVEGLQMPDGGIAEALESESLTVKQNDSGSLNILHRLEEYSGKNVTVPEPEIETHPHAGEGDESPESRGTSSTCMADKAGRGSYTMETSKEGTSADDDGCLHLEINGSGGPSEISENLDVSHVSQEELAKEVHCTVDVKQVDEIRNRSPECENDLTGTEVEVPSFAVKESHPLNQLSEDVDLGPANASSKSREDQTASGEVEDAISVCPNEDTALEVKDSDIIVESNSDKDIHNVPITDSGSSAGNDHREIINTAKTLGGVEASDQDDDKNITNMEVEVADGVQAGNDQTETSKHTTETLGGAEPSDQDDDKNIMNMEVKVADGVQAGNDQTETSKHTTETLGGAEPSDQDDDKNIMNMEFKAADGVQAGNDQTETSKHTTETLGGAEASDQDDGKNITNMEVKVADGVQARNDHTETSKHTAGTLGAVEASSMDDDKNITNMEVKLADGVQVTTEEPSGLSLDGDKVDKQLLKRKFFYIIRVPKFTDDESWAKSQHAQLEVDEKTKKRDSVHMEIQKQKVVSGGYRNILEATKADERAARARCNAKRQEISSIQSIIYKLNKVTSIEEIDEMIELKERSLQHETMSLKQEKLFIQEIKGLKAERKKLSSNMGSKAEIDEAVDQRDQIYERLGNLKKELDILGGYLGQAEEKTKLAQKNYDDEQQVLNNLREQFDAADAVRQKAYVYWRNLKSESTKKNKCFFMYKDDKKVVANYLSSGDMEGLWLHCNNQVEKIMELWNTNQEFRQQYVESNKNSTLRRLGTLDGRSLGPDESPPILHSNTYKKSSSPSPMSAVTLLSVAPEQKLDKSGSLAASTVKDSFPILPPAQTNQPSSSVADSFPVLPPAQQSSQSSKSGKSKSASKERASAAFSDREEVEYAEKEKASKKEEELAKNREELAREEELRMEKAAAEKERCRLEQMAKAKEAQDRKKRKAEKAKERAEYIARKEAELRDKRRAKKEKKKAAEATDTANPNVETENETSIATYSNSSQITQEPDVPVTAGSKRRSRSVVAVKQLNRIQPVPLALKNKGKRKTHTWIWVLLSSLLVLVLLLAGNYMTSSSFSFTWFGV